MRKSLPRFSIPRPAALSNYDDDDDDDDDDDGDDDDDDDDDEPPRGPLVFTSWRPQQVFICAGLPRRALTGSIGHRGRRQPMVAARPRGTMGPPLVRSVSGPLSISGGGKAWDLRPRDVGVWRCRRSGDCTASETTFPKHCLRV